MKKQKQHVFILSFVIFLFFYCIALNSASYESIPQKIWFQEMQGRARAVAVWENTFHDTKNYQFYGAERVYFGGENGLVHCFKVDSTQLRVNFEKAWQYQAEGEIIGSSIDVNGQFYFSAKSEGSHSIHCLNLNGQEIWNLPVENEPWGLVTNNKGKVYCAENKIDPNNEQGDGWIIFLNSNGDITRRINIGENIWGLAVNSEGELLCGTYEGNLYHFGLTGEIKNIYKVCNGKIKGIAVDSKGNIYCGSENCSLYKITPKEKTKKGAISGKDTEVDVQWQFETQGIIRAVLVDENDFIYLSSDDGHIYFLNPEKEILETFYYRESQRNDTDQKVYSLAVGKDQKVFFCNENSFHCVKFPYRAASFPWWWGE